jgi:hypothetical protein
MKSRQIGASGEQSPWYIISSILQPPDVNLSMVGSAGLGERAGTMRQGILALYEQ